MGVGVLSRKHEGYVLRGGGALIRYFTSITEALVGGSGRVGEPRGLIVNVVPGSRGAQMSPDPGPTPGRPVAG